MDSVNAANVVIIDPGLRVESSCFRDRFSELLGLMSNGRTDVETSKAVSIAKHSAFVDEGVRINVLMVRSFLIHGIEAWSDSEAGGETVYSPLIGHEVVLFNEERDIGNSGWVEPTHKSRASAVWKWITRRLASPEPVIRAFPGQHSAQPQPENHLWLWRGSPLDLEYDRQMEHH
uniref:Uncharacterized protein n=1 Tax=Rhizophagus irregularis (strain DAOM 181602 / DAOM 197198 / MUCL 43194) TaxID=747089 RepID=U9SI94_RHIID